MERRAIMMKVKDNVGTALADLKAGSEVELTPEGQKLAVVLAQDIPFGHKFAVREISVGEQVIKYGESIGTASQMIVAGTHAHIHNVDSNRGRGDK